MHFRPLQLSAVLGLVMLLNTLSKYFGGVFKTRSLIGFEKIRIRLSGRIAAGSIDFAAARIMSFLLVHNANVEAGFLRAILKKLR